MSTLLIEGGKRLSGAVAVEGNKNAALPLIAACLLTTEECVLHNMPRISDVEVMVRLLLDLGAEVEGIGSTTLRIKCPQVIKDEPDATLVGSPARVGPSPRTACWRVEGALGSHRLAEISRRGGPLPRTSKPWSRWASASSTARGMRSRRPAG